MAPNFLRSNLPGSEEGPGIRSSKRLYPAPLPTREPRKALRQIFEILRRGKWLVLAVTTLMVAAAFAYTKALPETYYNATALLLVDSNYQAASDDALSYGYVDAPSQGGRTINNQILILQQSLAIAERTAERLLTTNETSGGPYSFENLSVRDLAVRLQSGYITISAITDRGVVVNDAIRVTATSTNPREAVLIANTYAEEYVNRTHQESRQRIAASRQFLDEQVTKRQQELRKWEEQIKEMGRAGAVSLDAETQRTIGQIANLEAQLDEARIEKSMRQAALNSAERELQELHPKLTQRMASGVAREIDLTQQKIAELELVIGEYESRRAATQTAPGTTDVNQLSGQVELLKDRVRVLSDQYVSELLTSGGLDPKAQANGYVAQLNQNMVDERIAISGIDAKISALERRLDGYSRRLESIPQQSMQLAQVHRARQTAEAMYLRLTEKLEEATLAEESKVGYAEVLRPALAAYGPTGDPRARILVMGLLVGLLLGMVAAFARHKLDERIYTPDDVQDKDLGLLSAIPDMRAYVKKEFGKNKKTVVFEGREVNTMLVSLLRPQSAASEAYRRLYLSIQFSRPDTVVQTILVTSPEEGAGKSTTAINLAVTAARTGRRTLIVDGDLRQPSVHAYLKLPASPGLSEQLRAPGGALSAYDLRTGTDNLFVLPAGGPVEDSTRTLSSKELRDLIQTLRAEFDVIVFDSPPVLLTTDAAILSTQSDATVVVTSAGRTSSDALKQAIEELSNVGAPVVGTVLNRFDPTYMYGYQDTYGYRYKQYEYAAR